MKNLKTLIAGMFILLAGCKSSKITSSRIAKNSENKIYTKILVLGLIHENDRSLQENMEEHVAGDLRKLGYTIVTSLNEFGPKAFDNLTERQAVDKLHDNNIDAVITIVLLNKKVEKQFVPLNNNLRNTGYYTNHFWNYYGSIKNRVFEPGYYVDNTEYFWESNFYRVHDQKLLYTAQAESYEAFTNQALAHVYCRAVIRNMIRKKVLTDGYALF